MVRLWKKIARRRRTVAGSAPALRLDLDDSSPADLRRVIDELETAIAEREATNAFLRELLTERWFAADAAPARAPQVVEPR